MDKIEQIITNQKLILKLIAGLAYKMTNEKPIVSQGDFVVRFFPEDDVKWYQGELDSSYKYKEC